MEPLIAGNWKMNGLGASLREVERLGAAVGGKARCDILICPPATLLAAMAPLAARFGFAVGGQDCHAEASGAHTGDISAEMLKDAGARFVIVGHSERRADHDETDSRVRLKADAGLRAGLTPIVCVGETADERKAGEAETVVGAQLQGSLPKRGDFVVAYEPVWAIGTGVTPTADDIARMHAFIRTRTNASTRILYGGSVKPANAGEILALENVNGALVGGASLKADDFSVIIGSV
ncbi:MAG TPA: triose-phosphate isomerase [Parvularculaceae bacterium]|nr:triose-phosphate isomerase [Parvularculaceae bacterium]